ncbi:tyrosine-type recombinase/integrase [Streptosporangium sp. NPDC023825]|uniref:tyrosine-type recombinase/integrase n=1 Tax=Streptosporangium sp. NPDC023825 TaxID=3154909 RepID=UPI0034120790
MVASSFATRPSRERVAGWFSVPEETIPEPWAHLDEFAEQGENGHVFIGPKGGLPRRSGFRRIWNKVLKDVGLPALRFHDLRHVGNTLAAADGASLKELMSRMGHASARAALIYQHASRDRDKVIAAALGKALAVAQEKEKKKVSGTQVARKLDTSV